MKFTLPIAAFLVLLFGVLPGRSQNAADFFKVEKFQYDAVSTPDVAKILSKRTNRKTSWLEFEVSFKWLPFNEQLNDDPFLNSLQVEVYALLEPKTKAFPVALLSGKTEVEHVQADTVANVALYLSPRYIERLFAGRPPANLKSAVTNAAVILTYNGEIVATKIATGNTEFWKDPSLKVISGQLLPRSQTPFAHAVWDYYEQEKVAP